MSEQTPEINNNRYYYGLPILSKQEESMLDYQLNNVPDLLANLALFARQTDREHQLDNLIKRARNNHDYLSPMGVTHDEIDIIGEGIEDGYLAVTGLFELINIRRVNRSRHGTKSPLFPLNDLAMKWAVRVQKNIVDSIDFFEKDQNRDNLSDKYIEASPGVLNFLSSLVEKNFDVKNIDSPEALEPSYKIGFSAGAESMIVIHYLVNMEREIEGLRQSFPFSIEDLD